MARSQKAYVHIIISSHTTGEILNPPCRVSSHMSRVELALNRPLNSPKSKRAKPALFSLQMLKEFDCMSFCPGFLSN